MSRSDLSKSVRLWLVVCVLLTSMNSLAQDDADTKVALSYTFTESALTKYTQATRNLAALPDYATHRCDDDADVNTLADAVAMLNSMPGANTAIRSAGLTTREYVVFSWSLLHNALAAWAVSEPGGSLPPGTSQANLDFLKTHEAAMQQLNALQSSDSCNDGGYEDDEREEDSGEEEYEE